MAKRNTAGFVLFTLAFLALLFMGGMILLWRFAEWDRTHGPEMALEHHHQGVQFMRQGNPQAALDAFSAAVEIDADLADSWAARARIQARLGMVGAARADYDEAIRIEPGEPTHYMGRAAAADQLGELAPAIDDYSRALELTGLDPATQRRRAWARLRTGDYLGAVEDYSVVLESLPADIQVRHRLAWAYWGRSDFDRAADLFTVTIDSGRAPLHAYFGRGATRLYAGDPRTAVTDLAQAVGMNDKGREYARLYLWVARAAMGDRERADRDLSADALAGGWVGMLQQLMLGDVDEPTLLDAAAASSQRQSLTVTQRECEAFYYLGMLRAIQDRSDEAIEHFRRCLDTGETTFYEYYGARAELQRRGIDDRSPPEPTPPLEGAGA